MLTNTVSFFLVRQFSRWSRNTPKKVQTRMRAHIRRNMQCRINKGPTIPLGPNQLGQLSKMYSLARTLHPYLQHYPITAKSLCHLLSFLALCAHILSSISQRICSSPSKWATLRISLYKTDPVSQLHILFIASFHHWSHILPASIFSQRGKWELQGEDQT